MAEKKIGQSYDDVARFQLESRARNQDFWDRKIKEGNGTRAAERRKLNHYIEGSGGRQEGSATLINKKEQRGSSIEDKRQKEKRCIVPMVSAGKHGRLQRATV